MELKKSAKLAKCYPELENNLLEEIDLYASVKFFKRGETIVKQGQYIKYLPIVLSGCAKVFCNEEEKDFLLYFIQSGESCVYSFAYLDYQAKSDFSATAEEDSELLLMPLEKVQLWMQKYPSLSKLILSNYKTHYLDLLNTTKQIVCYRLEERLLLYLQSKAKRSNTNLLSISHQQIALDLGTSREVISRLLKGNKLDGYVQQQGRKIKVLIE